MSFPMTSHAFQRPSMVDPEHSKSLGSQANPLEEFARLMGTDIAALKDFDEVADPPTRLQAARAPARGDSLQPVALLFFEAALTGEAAKPRSRRVGIRPLGVLALRLLVAGRLGGWVAAWVLN